MSRKPRWPPGPSLKAKWLDGRKVGKRGSQRYERARRISLSPKDVPRWDRYASSRTTNELFSRRSFVRSIFCYGGTASATRSFAVSLDKNWCLLL